MLTYVHLTNVEDIAAMISQCIIHPAQISLLAPEFRCNLYFSRLAQFGVAFMGLWRSGSPKVTSGCLERHDSIQGQR